MAADTIPLAAFRALAAELRAERDTAQKAADGFNGSDWDRALVKAYAYAAARIEALCGAEPRDAAQSAREAVPHSVLGLGEEREWTCIACGEWVPDPAKSCAQCGS